MHAHRTLSLALARRSWQSLNRPTYASIWNPTPFFGKGSTPAHNRLLCSASQQAVVGSPPMNTDWASPSEDDIHVSDVAGDGVVPFSSFPLNGRVLDSLKTMGCENTFEIQGKTIPLLLGGRDVIGRAVTGSGKTLAFALPVVHILSKSPRTQNPRALVITPTRELCNQVFSCIQSLDHDVRCVALYGGVPYSNQENALRRGVDVIVATPGRLNDHFERGNFGLDDMKFLVLDEADELLTPNFKMQIEQILEDCPKDKQVMLFSATMPPDIRSVTRRYMKNAEMVDLVTNRSLMPEGIVHEACRVKSFQKMTIVPDLLLSNQPKRALVFTPTKAQTHVLGTQLSNLGFKAAALNSDMSQTAREVVLGNFRKGSVEVLVATDVAARGLDIPDIELVIHVGIPPNGVEFYIHRSGRTGRKGLAGKTILIYSDRDLNIDRFMADLRRDKIKLNEIRPPSNTNITELLMKNAVSKLKPESFSADLMEIARPYAQELTEKHGCEALTTALVSLSNLESRMGRGDDYGDQSPRNKQRGGGRDPPWSRRGNSVSSSRRGGGGNQWGGRYGNEDGRRGGYAGGGRFQRDSEAGGGRYQRDSEAGGGRYQRDSEDGWKRGSGRSQRSYDDEGAAGGMDTKDEGPWGRQQEFGKRPFKRGSSSTKREDAFEWDE